MRGRQSIGMVAAVALAMLVVHAVAVVADDDATDPVLEQSRRRVEPIQMQRDVDGAWNVVPLIEQPALRFEERSRDNSGGSVWLWGVTGRPAAVLELYQQALQPEDWIFVVNNLSGGTIRAIREDNEWWRENESDVEMSPLPDAPGPASRPTARLLQMRSLARRFQAHEFWDPDHSRFNLRLLPRPLHRYDDEDEGTIDGTLFVFANGTNPEACLLIEAQSNETGDPAWKYGLARLGHAEIHVNLDGESVWRTERVDQTPNREPYWLWYASFPVEPEADAAQQLPVQ